MGLLDTFSTGVNLATPYMQELSPFSAGGGAAKSGLFGSFLDKLGGVQGVGTALTGLGSVWSAYNTGQANKQNYNLMKKMYNADQGRLNQAQDNLDTAVLTLGDYNKKYGV